MGKAISIKETTVSDEFRWNLLQKKMQELRVLQAFDLLRNQHIEPILIKGLAAGLYYPHSKPRISIDTDLAVSATDFEAAHRIAASAAANGLAIDLHRELRHLDSIAWNDLFDNSQLLDIDGGSIRVLRPEDHLRVLCIHWLTDGGSNKDRLWDIYYLIENRPADFDWDRLLNSVSEKRRRWIVSTIGLAHRYLGLNVEETPISDEARVLPNWLIRAVEKEWAAETNERPLEFSMFDSSALFIQIKKRLHPNPIRATVQMEGSFDAGTRIHYQLGNLISRVGPTARRIAETLGRRLK